MRQIQLGSVSSGTMRAEDLIPCFVDVLTDIDSERCTAILKPYPEYVDASDSNDDFWESESAGWLLDALFDELSEHAPDYCYFGAHPGDGADYGFWLEEDFQARMQEDDVQIVDDLSKVSSKSVAIVNDHGNVSYGYVDASGYHEIWAVV